MKRTQFCCSCRAHHETSLMQVIYTKRGFRWRCTRSIEAASASQAERDYLGKQQTEINREYSRLAAHSSPRAASRLYL